MNEFNQKLAGSPELQQNVRKAIFNAIEGEAKKHGFSVMDHLEKSYANKSDSGCVEVTNTNFCITL